MASQSRIPTENNRRKRRRKMLLVFFGSNLFLPPAPSHSFLFSRIKSQGSSKRGRKKNKKKKKERKEGKCHSMSLSPAAPGEEFTARQRRLPAGAERRHPPPSPSLPFFFLFRAPSAENDDEGKRYLLSLLHTVDAGRRDHCNPSLPASVLSPNVSLAPRATTYHETIGRKLTTTDDAN